MVPSGSLARPAHGANRKFPGRDPRPHQIDPPSRLCGFTAAAPRLLALNAQARAGARLEDDSHLDALGKIAPTVRFG